jgi:hypothetical protein
LGPSLARLVLLLLLFFLLGWRFVFHGNNVTCGGIHLYFRNVFGSRCGNIKGPDNFAMFLLNFSFLHGSTGHLSQGNLLRPRLGYFGLAL